ncbi:MAG TPA: hypothetical protein VJX66_31535, partial [Amycolatopsis sp.]|nr:hypothetical protein [Amycolatopsis sp.]
MRFRWPVTTEKLARAIPPGTAALEGAAAGALARPSDFAVPAALGSTARAAPPAVVEAADPVLAPRLMR